MILKTRSKMNANQYRYIVKALIFLIRNRPILNLDGKISGKNWTFKHKNDIV